MACVQVQERGSELNVRVVCMSIGLQGHLLVHFTRLSLIMDIWLVLICSLVHDVFWLDIRSCNGSGEM